MTKPTDERAAFARVEEIFHAALELPAPRRRAFVEQSCADDRALCGEVLALLQLQSSASGFLDRPAALPDDVGTREPGAGFAIDRWTLERRIGVGGMGVVWLARRTDGAFEQRAALKRLRTAHPTADEVARFRRERDVLARLEHEHVARLLDGGVTADGCPWLAMEYVDGQPLIEWCDARGLTVRQRVTLFLDVCGAVAFAHRHLVVHRDLKPSNVLVTHDGVVKLLDFGISKVLESDANVDATRTGQRPFTPAYASPEQIRAQPITTATDVWSLGVVLYELLTGARPHRATSASTHDIERAICDEPPTRLTDAVTRAATDGALSVDIRFSTDIRRLRRQLDGDLETIVLKALQKEPERRYASVEAFASDLRRWLDGLPIAGRPDRLGYRLSKFVARNRLVCVAGAAALAFLVAGFVTSALLWRDATDEAERANLAEAQATRRLDDVRVLVRRMMLEVHDEIARLPGATAARDRLARTTSEYLDGLAADAGDDTALLCEVADGYARVAEIQAGINIGSVGKHDEALVTYDKLLAVVGQLQRVDAKAAALRRLRATAGQARVLLHMGRVAASRELLSRLDGATDAHVDDFESNAAVAQVHEQLAQSLQGAGQPAEALVHVEKAIELWNTIEAAAQDETNGATVDGIRPGSKLDARHSKRAMETNRAGLLLELFRFDEAAQSAAESIEVAEVLVAERGDSAVFRLGLAMALLRGAEIDRRAVRWEQALVRLERAGAILATAHAADGQNVLIGQRRLGVAITRGDVLKEMGRVADAFVALQSSLDLAETVAAASPHDHGARHNVAALLVRCAECAMETDVATAYWRRAVDTCSELLGADGELAVTKRLLVTARTGLGKSLVKRGDAHGIEELRAAVAIAEEYVAASPTSDWTHEGVGEATYALAIAIEQNALDATRPASARALDYDEAIEWFARGRDAAARLRLRPDAERLVALYQADVDRCVAARAALPPTQ